MLGIHLEQVVRHILNDLERFGAKPIDFKAFLDIMTAKMGERDTKEDRTGRPKKSWLWHTIIQSY